MAKSTVPTIIVALIAAVALGMPLPRPAPSPLVREEQAVLVDGVKETWQLRWASPPKPWCDILDGGWETSPCAGFTYGEEGKLDLVRYRNDHEYERLHLTPFFTGFPGHEAVVQRWPYRGDDIDRGIPFKNSPEETALVSRVRARPTVKIISLADYDHDGNATEFYLQTYAIAGHRYGIVVGVSTATPHLHAFGTAIHPDVPLVLQPKEWEALRTARGAVRVMDWKCPDHGAETDTEYEIEAAPKGISVISREYAECGKESRRLLHEEQK